jgi:lipid-A-disaccharide synthase
LLPVIAESLTLLHRMQPNLTIAVPTVPHLADRVAAACGSWPFPVILVHQAQEKYDCFAAGTVALAASGTVALELAMAGLPSVIVYKVSPVTAFLARHIMGFKAKWACLVNMVMDQSVMPELLQEQCQPLAIARQLDQMLTHGDDRLHRQHLMGQAMDRLGYGREKPGLRAAEAILTFIAERTKP